MNEELKSHQTACPEYEALLEDYLNGALCDANVAVAAQHLEVCPRCSRAADAALASTRWIRETAEALGARQQPSPAFPVIVMARIRAAEAARGEGEGFWHTLVSLGRGVAVTAILAVALMAVYEARWAEAPQPNVASMRPSEARDLLSLPDPVRLPENLDEALVMVTETDHGNN